MNKLLYTLVFLLLSAGASIAQNKTSGKISGVLIDTQGQPVPFATVGLLKAKDTVLIKGTLTTDAGVYTFDHIGAGIYLVRATAVGFTKTFSPPFTVTAETTTFKVPDIKMQDNSQTLSAVTITSTKPLIEQKTDRMVMNVANSVLAAGNSAMEILERAPGVSVDKDDNISLQGKQGVTVMINDKLTYLSAAQLATLLRSTDGNTIESIELITTPSAKYDASGNSGIINIKLKKNKESGTNGSVILGVGYGNYFKDNESFSINHKDGALNVFANFSRNDNQRGRNIAIEREVIPAAGLPTYFNQNTFMPQISHNNSYRFGADYDLSPKNTIGFIVNGYFNTENDFNSDVDHIGSTPAVADSSQRTTSVFRQSYNNFAVNLNDRYQLTKSGQVLTADLDYSKFTNTNNAQYVTDYFFANGATQHQSVYLRNQSPSNIDIRTAKIDYTYPISKTLKLESGLKYSDVKTDNNLQAQILNNGNYINDTTRTNRFIYDEKISAGYVNLSKDYKNTSVQLGLRAEYTNSTGDLVTNNQVVSKKYLDLFPSFFVNQVLDKKNELGFSYSRRIDRPEYDNLNPFVYYLDPYTYSQGNPFLKPQFTNKYELHYTYNKTINVSLGYSQTNDVITQLLLTNVAQKASYETTLNLKTENAYNINVNTPYTISKWFTGNVNVNGFYNQFKSDTLLGANLNTGKLAYMVKVTQSLLFAGFRAEILESYQSSLVQGLFEVKPQYYADMGISRSFANKKLNIKFSVSDVFNTRTNNVVTNYQADNISINQKNETRISRLTLTYNFGNSKIKAANHQTGAEDEKGRVKGSN